MARYISQYSGFQVNVLGPTSSIVQNEKGLPEFMQTSEGYVAKFRQQGLLPWETEAALERFAFKGIGEDEDAVQRCSVFDTDQAAREEGWDPQTTDRVIKRLDQLQDQNFFRADTPKAPIPWPSYDSADPSSISKIVQELGLDPEGVALYESENKARRPVLEALASLGGKEPDEIVVSS